MSLLDSLLLDPHAFNVWIAYCTDGIRGTGTLNDPYNGSTQASFDAIMSGLPNDTPPHVHLGPTSADKPFRTGGFFLTGDGIPGTGAWQAKPNLAIVGSGIDVTYLQLITDSAAPNTHWFAIGAPTTSCVDFLEVSGLTIDCKLPNNRTIACGAIRVMGHHVRIRDVKCINWGSRTTAQPGFVIALIIAGSDDADHSPWLAVDDSGIENCIAVSPSQYNNVANAIVNVLHAGGTELPDTPAVTQFGRAPFIRNCFVDAGSPDSDAVVRALSMDGCHGGIVEGNQIHNATYGGPYHQKLNSREIIVRNNIYRNVCVGPNFVPLAGSTGVQNLLIEGNIIELITTELSGVETHAIYLQGGDGTPYSLGSVIIRNNRVRFVDGAPGSMGKSVVQAGYASAVVITDNVIEPVPTTEAVIVTVGSTAVTFHNNRDADGELIIPDTDRFKTQLAIPAEETLVPSCFEK